ncbi:MAG: NFACT family protein [Chloroflexi bacterium]|nr:NFACT family protein [Chloroflexota bacterium]
MHFDALVARAIADEWREYLIGGRVDRLFQPDAWSLTVIVRNLHANQQVLVSFNPATSLAYVARSRKLVSGFEEPTAFVMLLRKYLEGARVTAVGQPALERRIDLQCSRSGESPVTLRCELAGRQANLILVDSNEMILGLARPVTSAMSRVRTLLPGRQYVPPAPVVGEGSKRLDPRSITSEELARSLTATDTDSPESLRVALTRILPISPTASAEVVHRAQQAKESTTEDGPEALLANEIRSLFQLLDQPQARWEPCIALSSGDIKAFAPYALTYLAARGDVRSISSMSEAIERFSVPRAAEQRLAHECSTLRSVIKPVLERIERRATALQRDIDKSERDLRYRHLGELLLTFRPETDTDSVEVVDYETGDSVRIAVDSALSAVQNAEQYFAKYARVKRALEVLKPQLRGVQTELAFVQQLAFEAEVVESPAEAARLRQELKNLDFADDNRRLPNSGLRGNPRQRRERVVAPAASQPDSFIFEGFEILYGKTSHANDLLTFKIASKHDVWLHAKGAPGSHVVIRTQGRAIPEHVLGRGAQVAAYFSSRHSESTAPVDYTEVGRVRRQAVGKPGLVWYSGEHTLVVQPAPPKQ